MWIAEDHIAHLNVDKWVLIYRWNVQMHIISYMHFIFLCKSNKVCHQVSIDWYHGLAPRRRTHVICVSNTTVHWHTCVSSIQRISVKQINAMPKSNDMRAWSYCVFEDFCPRIYGQSESVEESAVHSNPRPHVNWAWNIRPLGFDAILRNAFRCITVGVRQEPWWNTISNQYKYSLLMRCIKIKSPAKSLLNEQYVFVGGNISFLCVLSCSSEEA